MQWLLLSQIGLVVSLCQVLKLIMIKKQSTVSHQVLIELHTTHRSNFHPLLGQILRKLADNKKKVHITIVCI